MGGPAFDRQVFVKKQKAEPPSRSPLPGALALLLVAGLAAFATYRYVKAGGKSPSNPADLAKIQELQTKLKKTQARVDQLEKRRHVSTAKRSAPKSNSEIAKTGSAAQPHTMATKAAAHPADQGTSAAHTSAGSSTNSATHPTASKEASAAPHKTSSSSAANSVSPAELKAQLASAQAASNKKLSALQNDLTANHENWQATTDRLGNVVGQVDSQKNAIQKNQTSVNYLLERVHRSDVSFTLTKGGALQHVGPISMKLESTSVKGQHYSIRMNVDDKSVELKDRALNEVVEFYTSRSRYPLRLIVSRIQKGVVSGTLAVPYALGQEANSPQAHQLQER